MTTGRINQVATLLLRRPWKTSKTNIHLFILDSADEVQSILGRRERWAHFVPRSCVLVIHSLLVETVTLDINNKRLSLPTKSVLPMPT
jgi:hypothetical protein